MTRDDLNVAIMDDAAKHVRPKMMTVVSSTVLTLLVIPAIQALVKARGLSRAASSAATVATLPPNLITKKD